MTQKIIILLLASLATAKARGQVVDTPNTKNLGEIVVAASRKPEHKTKSPVSIVTLSGADADKTGALSCFDALANVEGVHTITPGLSFKVLNTRGFANTTNVRFSQLIDGVDNQAPHIGAPIANALGANDLDIERIEIVQGTASALYGMNSLNGLANIVTKNPFSSSGLSVQQLTGVNHTNTGAQNGPQLYSQTNIRWARAINNRWAFKINGALNKGRDWVADNRTDLAATVNSSLGLTGADNPAYDEVNGYGNESSNRRTLTLSGKKIVVARTGYREAEIENYELQNIKGDAGLYFRPKDGNELSITYKGALINNTYQRSNRFRLQDYALHQYAVDYHSNVLMVRGYITQENTGKSYNIRSLAENMDRSFKTDDKWFTDFTTAYNKATTDGAPLSDALKNARSMADNGRYVPGSAGFNAKRAELIDINNWDYGAALRVKSYLLHSEGLVYWDKIFPVFFTRYKFQVMSGFDHRTYIIIPDGNYFINPTDTGNNLNYSKSGGFLQVAKDLLKNRLTVGATLRADYADYFNWKINPRLTAVYSPTDELSIRASYQSGYRFPSIFEGFSNVVSGGVKRVGGLRVMSDGVFEQSYTKASIDAFQAKVNADVNSAGQTQVQAIANNKAMLKKNPYTYLQPEYVQSGEMGIRGVALSRNLYVDASAYYNAYENFIAQVEASIPKTTNPDSVATYLYSASKQNKYRLWTNSKSKIRTYGATLKLNYNYTDRYNLSGSITYSQLDRTENKDGLEDGYNTPRLMCSATAAANKLWKNLGAGITYRYQTEYNYVSFLVNGVVPAFWTLDAQITYTLKRPEIVAKLGATNLTNTNYYSMLGGPQIGGLYYLSLTYNLK